MKRLFAVLAVGLVAVATYALAAPAGQQALSPKQVAQLSKKVNRLSKTVARLQRQLKQLDNCLHADPVIRPGGSTEGYLYRTRTGAQETRSAVDFTDVGSRAYTWVLTTTSGCATLLNS